MAGSSFRAGILSAALAAAAMGPSSMMLANVEPIDTGPLGDGRYPRSKGKQTRPKKRPNMLHVSKRVRRKHRRARR